MPVRESVERTLEARSAQGWEEYLESKANERIARLAAIQAEFVVSGCGAERSTPLLEHRAHAMSRIDRECFAGEHSRIDMPAPSICIVPHLAMSKLMIGPFNAALRSGGVRIEGDVPQCEPWLWRHVAAFHLARVISAEFVPVEQRYGGCIGAMQERYGAILIDAVGRGRSAGLIDILRRRLNSASLVVFGAFPEGGSTGKRVGDGNPFSLEPFYTGIFYAARELGVPIVPVAHVVNRWAQSSVSVLAPIAAVDLGSPADAAVQVRTSMQREMNRLLESIVCS